MRRILILGDTHCGAVTGLWHPEYKTRHQNTIKLNPLQEEIYEKWEQMKEDVQKRDSYDTIFLMGDLIDGLNRKSFGRERMVSDLNEQVGCVLKLLRPLCKNKEVFGIQGSGYHGSLDYEVDRRICHELHGQYGGSIANIRLKSTNKIINISHGSGFPAQYIGSKMSKEILLSIMSAKLEKTPNIDILIRGHFHEYAHLEMLNKHFILNPCWEGARRNLHSAPNYLRFQSTIGCVKLEISDDDVIVNPYIYPISYERKNIKLI